MRVYAYELGEFGDSHPHRCHWGTMALSMQPLYPYSSDGKPFMSLNAQTATGVQIGGADRTLLTPSYVRSTGRRSHKVYYSNSPSRSSSLPGRCSALSPMHLTLSPSYPHPPGGAVTPSTAQTSLTHPASDYRTKVTYMVNLRTP